MSDITMSDVIKMKVLDLRKELKSRGLQSTGDKAVLIERLQAALSNDIPDDHGDINLDSDEIDSEGVLDEDDKQEYDLSTESPNEELLVDQPLPSAPIVKNYPDVESPVQSLKRKIEDNEVKEPDSKTKENREASAKKIILNRAISTTNVTPVTPSSPASGAEKTEEKDVKPDSSTNNDKIKVSCADTRSRLELRAKRFGLPVKMTDAERKEARKLRFGQNATIKIGGGAISKPPLSENLDKLKKRAERFGQSVSKFMTDVENKEKLEKRKAKFGTVQ